MRSAVVCIALLLAAVTARADIACIPITAATPPPIGTGSAEKEVETAAGTASGFWCKDPVTAATPPGKVTYSPQYTWALNKYKGHPDLRGAWLRVSAAGSILDAINGEIRAGSVSVAPGSQDEYDVKLLKFKVCQALATPPYLVPIDPLPANWCGPAPVPPGDTYKTPATGSFTIFTYASGRLTGVVSGRKATPNTACDCTTSRATSGTVTYCSIGNPTEVTACVKQ